MLTVAERFVVRCAATAKGDFVAPPGVSARSVQDADIPGQQHGPVLGQRDFERSARGGIRVTLLANSAIVAKASIIVRVVAIRFVLRVTAAAQGGTEPESGYLGVRPLDVEISPHEQRTVIGDVNCVLRVCRFFSRTILVRNGQRTGGAAQNDVLHLIVGHQIRLTPGFSAGDEQVSLRPAAFTNMNAQSAVSAYRRAIALVFDRFFICHYAGPSINGLYCE